MSAPRHLRGSTLHCPKCASSKVGYEPNLKFKGYGPGIAVCRNCEATWEPFLPEHLWDPSDPVASFKDPCNNCAFRPGSPEQKDPAKWRELIGQLSQGQAFYCHKGVPIEPDAEHGFAYPQKTVPIELGDLKTTTTVADRSKLRLCRGFLNQMEKLHRHLMKGEAA
jgi:transcription elongation factor Elf1